MKKVGNTKQLAIMIKILQVLGLLAVGYGVFVIIVAVGLEMYFTAIDDNQNVENSVTTICSIDNKKYQIEFGTDGYFKCVKCSNKLKNDLMKLTDFNNIDASISNIEGYFESHNGTCE